MATYATSAEWSANLKNLTVWPELGEAFISNASIFAAFGVPQMVPPGDIKINWTEGGTAAIVNPSTYASTGTIAKVDKTKTLSAAIITAPAQSDIVTLSSNNGWALDQSILQAVESIYTKWTDQLINGVATNLELYGLEQFLTDAATMTGVGVSTNLTGTEATILADLTKLRLELCQMENNFLLCGPNGYMALEAAIQAAGGTTPTHLGMANMGFDVMAYNGMPVIQTKVIDESSSYPFYMINRGPRGVKSVTPDVPELTNLSGLFYSDGPKSAPGILARWWDIALCHQLIFATPRSAGKLDVTPTGS